VYQGCQIRIFAPLEKQIKYPSVRGIFRGVSPLFFRKKPFNFLGVFGKNTKTFIKILDHTKKFPQKIAGYAAPAPSRPLVTLV
jgi:hypothetical protein